MVIRSCVSDLATWRQALRHSSSMFGGFFQLNEDPDGDSFPFGYPVRCCTRCVHGAGKPEITDPAYRLPDSEGAARMAGRFLHCAIPGNAFAGDIWCRY